MAGTNPTKPDPPARNARGRFRPNISASKLSSNTELKPSGDDSTSVSSKTDAKEDVLSALSPPPRKQHSALKPDFLLNAPGDPSYNRPSRQDALKGKEVINRSDGTWESISISNAEKMPEEWRPTLKKTNMSPVIGDSKWETPTHLYNSPLRAELTPLNAQNSMDTQNKTRDVGTQTNPTPKSPTGLLPLSKITGVSTNPIPANSIASQHIQNGFHHTEQQTSPISIGPQSAHSSLANQIASPQPPTPDSLHAHIVRSDQAGIDLVAAAPDSNECAKYISAFDFAMRPYLEEHTALECHLHLPQHDVSSAASSPLFVPLRGDEISDLESDDDDVGSDIQREKGREVPGYDIPPHLKKRYATQTHIRHIQLRTLLMRCTVLQTTVWEIERKPWVEEMERRPYWYYSKMRRLACKAQRFAEALKSRDLQARCEYWAGRGSGGTRDYLAAKQHFKRAVILDVENDQHTNGKPRHRGLRPAEKGDVHFLLKSVSERHEDWEMRTIHARRAARYESEKLAIPIRECIKQTDLDSPLWMPDRDRAMQLARHEFGIQKKLGTHARYLGDMERAEDSGEAQQASEVVAGKDLARGILSQQEWKYIKRERQESVASTVPAEDPLEVIARLQKPAALAETPHSVDAVSSATLAGSQKSPHDDPEERPEESPQNLASELDGLGSEERSSPFSEKDARREQLNLADELEGEYWDEIRSPSPTPHSAGSPSPSSVALPASRIPSPETAFSSIPAPLDPLTQRRNVHMQPLETSRIQKPTNLGSAVRTGDAEPGDDDKKATASTNSALASSKHIPDPHMPKESGSKVVTLHGSGSVVVAPSDRSANVDLGPNVGTPVESASGVETTQSASTVHAVPSDFENGNVAEHVGQDDFKGGKAKKKRNRNKGKGKGKGMKNEVGPGPSS